MKLLKFFADWCQPCHAYAPTFEAVTAEMGVEAESVNVDERIDLATEYGVVSLPLTILLDENGVELRRLSGALSEHQLRDFINGE